MNPETPSPNPVPKSSVQPTSATAEHIGAVIRKQGLLGREHFFSLWAVPESRQQLLKSFSTEETVELDEELKSLRTANPEFEKSIASAAKAKLQFRNGLRNQTEEGTE